MAPRARAALSRPFRPCFRKQSFFAVYLGNSLRPFARFQSSCSNQPNPLSLSQKKKKTLIYTNHMGRPSEVGKYRNPYLYRKITSLISVNMTIIIWQHMECSWESGFCANATMSLTLAARIIVHIRTGASVFQVCEHFIFSRAPNMNHHLVCTHMSSSNEMHANKGTDTTVRSDHECDDMTDCDKRYRPKIQRVIKKFFFIFKCLYSFCFKDFLIFICLYNECRPANLGNFFWVPSVVVVGGGGGVMLNIFL